jgi:hypothetical protein
LGQLKGAGLLAGREDNVCEDLFQGLVVLVCLDLDTFHVSRWEQGAEPLSGLLVFLPDPGAGSDVLILGCGAERQLKHLRVPQLLKARRAPWAEVFDDRREDIPTRGDTGPGCQVVNDRDSRWQHSGDGWPLHWHDGDIRWILGRVDAVRDLGTRSGRVTAGGGRGWLAEGGDALVFDLAGAELLHTVDAVFDHKVHQEEGVGLLSLSGDGGTLSRKGGLEGGGWLHGDH